MALSDVMERIIYFTVIQVTGKEPIPIHPISVNNDRSKKISKRTPGKSSNTSDVTDTGNQVKDTKIRDRNRIENVYEVTGWIEPIETKELDATYFKTAKTAYNVKTELIKYVFNNNSKLYPSCMNYEQRAIYGTMEKLSISEEAMDKNANHAPRYSVKFLFVAIDNTTELW